MSQAIRVGAAREVLSQKTIRVFVARRGGKDSTLIAHDLFGYSGFVPLADQLEEDPLALEQQVCFALALTNRAVLGVYRPLLEPLGLTHPQYLVMLALWDHHRSRRATEQSNPLSVKCISTLLQLDSATLSPMLKRLESLGLIARQRNAVDERATNVRLTQAGVRLRRKALAVPDKVVARLGVELADLQQLRELLTRVNTAALGVSRGTTES